MNINKSVRFCQEWKRASENTLTSKFLRQDYFSETSQVNNFKIPPAMFSVVVGNCFQSLLKFIVKFLRKFVEFSKISWKIVPRNSSNNFLGLFLIEKKNLLGIQEYFNLFGSCFDIIFSISDDNFHSNFSNILFGNASDCAILLQAFQCGTRQLLANSQWW